MIEHFCCLPAFYAASEHTLSASLFALVIRDAAASEREATGSPAAAPACRRSKLPVVGRRNQRGKLSRQLGRRSKRVHAEPVSGRSINRQGASAPHRAGNSSIGKNWAHDLSHLDASHSRAGAKFMLAILDDDEAALEVEILCIKRGVHHQSGKFMLPREAL